MSLIGAASGVIAATYAAMAYYRVKAEDRPTLHVRFLESVGKDEYHLVLEIHPGKRSARYRALSIRGGYIGPKKNEHLTGILESVGTSNFRQCHKADIFVPPAVARDVGPDLSVAVRMRSSAVLSLRTRRTCFGSKLSVKITASMIDDW